MRLPFVCCDEWGRFFSLCAEVAFAVVAIIDGQKKPAYLKP